LTEAVAPLAGAYDLTDARARIATALAAGRAEVRLNHARQAARLQARDFDTELNARLAEAVSEAAVLELLDGAMAFSQNAEAALDEQLRSIIEEARSEPGLASRIEEAEAYADVIREDQRHAFADANAGAELAAAGANAKLAIASIKSRLMKQLAEATTADEVDARLGDAEGDAKFLESTMSDRLDAVI